MKLGQAKADPCAGALGRVDLESRRAGRAGSTPAGEGGRRHALRGRREGVRPGLRPDRFPEGKDGLPSHAPGRGWPPRRPRDSAGAEFRPPSPHVTRPPASRSVRRRPGREREARGSRRGARRRRVLRRGAGTWPGRGGGGRRRGSSPGRASRGNVTLQAPTRARSRSSPLQGQPPHLFAVEVARNRLPPRTTSTCPHRAKPAELAICPPAAPPPTCTAEPLFLPVPHSDVMRRRREVTPLGPPPRWRKPRARAKSALSVRPCGGVCSLGGRVGAEGIHAHVGTHAERCSFLHTG